MGYPIPILSYPLSGFDKLIFDRIMRNLPPDTFEFFDDPGSLPDPIYNDKLIILDDWDGWIFKQFVDWTTPTIRKARGYEFEEGGTNLVKRRVFPTYGPGVLRAASHLLPVVLWDMKKALRTIWKPEFPMADLTLHPTPKDLLDWLDAARSSPFLVLDLETVGGSDDEEEKEGQVICRASFGAANGKAITFPWIRPYVDIAHEAVASGRQKTVFWNGWGFDVHRLRENGIEPKGIVDAMELYHFLQPTLPKSLGAVSTIYTNGIPEWKSKSNSDPELYSAMDAWATTKCYLGTLKDLAKRGVADLAQRHVVDFQYVLDAMSRRGVLVSVGAQKQFNDSLDAKLDAIQAKFDADRELDQYRPLHPKKGFKKTPKDTTGMILGEFMDGNEKYLRWARLEPFKATSPQQVANYLRGQGHMVVNASDEVLSQIYRKNKDPRILDIQEYRGLRKLRGTYGNVPIGPDGRVHTQFTLKPTTGRLSSKEPNLQNWPKEAKPLLVASPGNKIVEADWASIEALLTGYFAHDEEYMRRAKIGIHKLAMAEYLGKKIDFSWTDTELRKAIKGIKEIDEKLYRQIKTVIYGGNYLAGARTIYRNNPTAFDNEGQAKKFLKFCQGLSPKIKEYQQATILQAARQKYLVNAFGYQCAFWDRRGDGPAACAFLPQSTVAAMMRETMLRIAATWAGEYMVLQVHDSLVFDVPEHLVPDLVNLVKEVMTVPWPELGGLSVGADVKVGDSLAFPD